MPVLLGLFWLLAADLLVVLLEVPLTASYTRRNSTSSSTPWGSVINTWGKGTDKETEC